jgi:spore germination cell wall hydrolase CwlJ-like protein
MKPALQKIFDQNLVDFGYLSDPKIMGLTIWAEARGEIEAGKIAVGTVILERVDKKGWMGKTIMDVCLMPYQFSCFLQSDPNRRTMYVYAKNWLDAISEDNALRDCYEVALGMLGGIIPRDPELAAAHCCQYLTTAAKANVDWWKEMKFIKKIGAHEFYA